MMRRGPRAIVVVALAAAGAGFVGGVGYSLAMLVEPGATASAIGPLDAATLRSVTEVRAEMRTELAELRRDLAARDARPRRSQPGGTVSPSGEAFDGPLEEGAAASSGRRPNASSRFPGGRPDVGTPEGQKLLGGLLQAARAEQDPVKREAALRSLATMFGADAEGALSLLEADPGQPAHMRELAAELRSKGASGRE